MIKQFSLILFIAVLLVQPADSQKLKILFDATKAESASNADWVIDADVHNLNFSATSVTTTGNESNPQRYPTPDQSTVTASTPETYWYGAISAWGIDCVKQGFQVETLPYNGLITYGSSSNAQDLSNYKVFVVCEPNIIFSSTEKVAILNFIKNGGGLFMVSDHDVSDRNGDNWDSPHIWNDLMTNNTLETNPFGISFDYVNISGVNTNILVNSKDSILHGPIGNVAEVEWFNGTTMTLTPTKNPSVSGKVYTNNSTNPGNLNVMFATARYGKGKVASIGDSSPCDDGTGDSGDTSLYNGYTVDAAGNHRPLLLNATIWLATSNTTNTTGLSELKSENSRLNIYPNQISNGVLNFSFSNSQHASYNYQILDLTGKIIFQSDLKSLTGNLTESANIAILKTGMYLLKLSTNSETIAKPFFILK